MYSERNNYFIPAEFLRLLTSKEMNGIYGSFILTRETQYQSQILKDYIT